jgi:hypothetical protein
MNPRLRKILLLLLAAVLLAGVFQVQESMNTDRDALDLTRVQPLENAPPVLAFTTVALGGFRGLISNILWIRATDLQDNDKYFEMAQLADWITKLEPHFVQVWLVQAWNMAYNISVKFKDFPDRWRWVERGLELLRDDGLRYNENETLIYRELAWFFQHKMGANMDDANMYYKQEWANEMAQVFGKRTPDLEPLIHPRTPDEQRRAKLLREKYKMDPQFMQEIDERYGPLEWRLPEAHAIYWAAEGLRHAELNPAKIKPDDLITLRRVIYQSMQTSFQRGRLVANPFLKSFEFGPNLEIIPKVSAAYEQAAKEDEKNRDHIEKAQKNFLKDAVYFLYVHNRIADAAQWYKYLGTKFPNSTLLDYQTNSYPRNLTLNEYAVSRVEEDVGETMSRDRIKAILEGLLTNALTSLCLGEDDHAAGYKLLAQQVHDTYSSKTKARGEALAISPLDDIQREVVNRMLDPEHGVMPEMRAVLRTKLNLGPEPPAPRSSTNAVPDSFSNK